MKRKQQEMTIQKSVAGISDEMTYSVCVNAANKLQERNSGSWQKDSNCLWWRGSNSYELFGKSGSEY
jgi:hypothetical protein